MRFPAPTENQGRILWTAATALSVAVILALSALFLIGLGWLAKQISSVLLPLAVAGIIAYLLDPVVDFFQRRKLSRAWSIVLVFFLALLFLGGLLAAAVPRLVDDAERLVKKIPHYQKTMLDGLNNFIEKPFLKQQGMSKIRGILEYIVSFFSASSEDVEDPDSPPTAPDGTSARDPGRIEPADVPDSPPTAPDGTDTDPAREYIETVLAWIGEHTADIGRWFKNQLDWTLSWFGLLAGFALVPVYVFYFLAEKTGIQSYWTDYLPVRESRIKDELVFVLHSINDALIVFFRSQVLVAMCVGLLLMIGFSLIRLPYAILLGFLAGALSIVPYLGVMLSIVPALIISVIDPHHGPVLQPILTLGVFVLVQTLEGLVISPKIIGDRVGLHPLTVIIAIMTGTTLLGGITGGVLAIPLTAALRTVMFHYVWKRREWVPQAPETDEETEIPGDTGEDSARDIVR